MDKLVEELNDMESSVKKEIVLMLIPLVGIWWLANRIIPDIRDVTWWDCSDWAMPASLAICVYQSLFVLLLKLITQQ